MYYVKTDDNLRIAVEDINPSGHDAVLFIHGWPLGRRIFEYQLDVLPKYGYRCITMDLRGFGQSDCPAGGYSYDRMARDVLSVIRNTRARNLTLAGFSMGGAIALRYVSRFHGHGVSKLALIGAAAPSFTQRPDYEYGMTKEEVNDLIEQTCKDRPQMAVNFGANLFAVPHSESLKEWFNQISWSASGIGTIETAKSLRDEDLREDLKHVHIPTGIFHGKLDKVCPYEFALLLNEGIKDSVLYPFENSGHAVFYDELESFNENFMKFIHNLNWN